MTTIEPTPSPVRAPGPAPAPSPDSGPDSGVRTAARGSALNLAGAITAAVVSFVTVGFITNSYGQVGAGLFFAATAMFTLAANGARLGSESGLTFFVSRFRAAGRQVALEPLVRTAAGTTTIAATALATLGFLAAPQLADLLTAEAANAASLVTMIRILAVAVPSFALSQVLFGATRGYGTMRPSVLAGQIFRPVAQLVFVVAAIVVSTEIWPLALAWAVASVATALGVAVWLWRRLRRPSSQPPSPEAEPFHARDYWRFAAPRAVTDLVSSALERLDILLVAYFLSAADAGLYGASNRLILAGQLLMYATAQSMAPLLSAAFLQRRYRDAKDLLHTITAWSVLLLWPLLLTLAFGAESVLALFGDGFADAAPVVRVLALALAVIVGLGPGDTLLLMTGNSVASLVNHVAALVVLLAVSVVLLPEVGVIGAAWAWAASRLLLRGLAVTQVWRTTRVHVFGRALALATIAAVVAFVPAGFAAHRLIDNGAVAVAAHLAVGGLVHLALAARFRADLRLDQLLGVVTRRSAPSTPSGATT